MEAEGDGLRVVLALLEARGVGDVRPVRELQGETVGVAGVLRLGRGEREAEVQGEEDSVPRLAEGVALPETLGSSVRLEEREAAAGESVAGRLVGEGGAVPEGGP